MINSCYSNFTPERMRFLFSAYLAIVLLSARRHAEGAPEGPRGEDRPEARGQVLEVTDGRGQR